VTDIETIKNVMAPCLFCGGPPCLHIAIPFPDDPELCEWADAHVWCHEEYHYDL